MDRLRSAHMYYFRENLFEQRATKCKPPDQIVRLLCPTLHEIEHQGVYRIEAAWVSETILNNCDLSK